MPALLLRLLAAVVLCAPLAGAQPASVTGTVRDASGAPLPGVSVYLSGTTRGTASDREGAYRIDAVAPGSYRLVGSMVGFEPAAVPVRLAAGVTTADLTLTEATASLAPVTVEAQADRRWQRQLAQFREALLGESANADSTRILNPEVLDFASSWGTLRATARAPLVIENRALGYRLRYDLLEFRASSNSVRYDGDEVFEPMTPASAAEGFRWAAARRRAWRGSLQHLLRSMLRGTDESEGFSLALRPVDSFRGRRSGVSFPTTAERLLRDGGGVPTLVVRGELEVAYDGEPEEERYPESDWFRERRRRPLPVQRSVLTVERVGAALDPDGTPADPFAITARGYIAFERLADRVPRDFLDGPPEAEAGDGDGG